MRLDSGIMVPGEQFPPWKAKIAAHLGTQNRILFTTWGGLGDQVCAEPVLRYAVENKGDTSISLWTEFKSLFKHIPFDDIFDASIGERPNLADYLVLPTIVDPQHMVWQFFSHCLTHCVDFPALCSLRMTLPIESKVVQLPGFYDVAYSNRVVIHPGRHWPSKTFPREWWQEVIDTLIRQGVRPVLIGKHIGANQGYVDVPGDGCEDLRDRTDLRAMIGILRSARLVITNDSAPLHIAATGKAFIGFVATAKHQDYIHHWRRNENGEAQWAWRMKHYNRGGIWGDMCIMPNKIEDTSVDKCTADQMKRWLPDPAAMALDCLRHAP